MQVERTIDMVAGGLLGFFFLSLTIAAMDLTTQTFRVLVSGTLVGYLLGLVGMAIVLFQSLEQ